MLATINILNEMINDFYRPTFYHTWSQETLKDGNYNIKLNIPGYDKDDLVLEFENDVLILTSKDKRIEKIIYLPEEVDVESLESKCEKGILSITGKSIKQIKNKKTILIK